MIAPGQVAAALERIDPRDRELLALSLRRRVPDDALALMYDVEPPEVARRRAAAIERLADTLEVQRGVDLGAVLKALLEEETWADSKLGAEFGGAAAAAPAPEPTPAPDPTPSPPPGDEESATPSTPDSTPTPAPPPAPVSAPTEPSRPRVPHVALALCGLGLVALAGAAGLVAITELGDEGPGASGGTDSGDSTRLFLPAKDDLAAAPFPSEPDDASCYARAHVTARTTLHREPGGKALTRLRSRTEWGTPRVLGVVEREGDWLAVQAPELPNEKIAWMRAQGARLDCVRWSLHVDLSKRVLFVREDGRTRRSFSVGIGRRGNPTPEGRFSVTDKLRVADRDSPYGCCVVALTGHQTRLPPSWPGGDRLAVHATTDLASIGRPATLGCLRVKTGEARWLIETIPLGAPIFVRS